MKKKNRSYLFLCIFLIMITVGLSYALWQIVLQQSSSNLITTGCFRVAFRDVNSINLGESYPISDEEGKSLVPYEFTITNTCDSLASFQINLEILNTTTLTDLNYIKSTLNESVGNILPKFLTSNEVVVKTLQDAESSYQLKSGYLGANEEKTYHLRLWMDENTPTADTYMNKTLQSKIIVTTAYLDEADTEQPVANFTTSRNETGIVIDAGSSTDNKGINTYYFSTDGINFVSSKESVYTISKTEEQKEYGVATDVIFKLYQSKINEVYVYVEDAFENKSEVKKQTIGDLALDGTLDNNLRYIGANPNNYVYFNCDDNANPTRDSCELWRIIGVMNNVDDGTGIKESRIKLIRNESIGNYSWDTSASAINSGQGVNEWSESDAMKLMNPGYDSESVGGSLYWNRGSGKCYTGSANYNSSCDFGGFGLKDSAKILIGESVWFTGDVKNRSGKILDFYQFERSNSPVKTCASTKYCNDGVTRTAIWTGYIGLMYPSDYGYSSSGSTTTNRETCLNNGIGFASANDCTLNNWLYHSDLKQWTISSFSYSQSASSGMPLPYVIVAADCYVYNSMSLFPALYLKSGIKIISGEGTASSPFVLNI